MRYKLKKAFFDGVPANEVRTTSPLRSMTDEQWQALVNMWLDPKHKVNLLVVGNHVGYYNHNVASNRFVYHS